MKFISLTVFGCGLMSLLTLKVVNGDNCPTPTFSGVSSITNSTLCPTGSTSIAVGAERNYYGCNGQLIFSDKSGRNLGAIAGIPSTTSYYALEADLVNNKVLAGSNVGLEVISGTTISTLSGSGCTNVFDISYNAELNTYAAACAEGLIEISNPYSASPNYTTLTTAANGYRYLSVDYYSSDSLLIADNTGSSSGVLFNKTTGTKTNLPSVCPGGSGPNIQADLSRKVIYTICKGVWRTDVSGGFGSYPTPVQLLTNSQCINPLNIAIDTINNDIYVNCWAPTSSDKALYRINLNSLPSFTLQQLQLGVQKRRVVYSAAVNKLFIGSDFDPVGKIDIQCSKTTCAHSAYSPASAFISTGQCTNGWDNVPTRTHITYICESTILRSDVDGTNIVSISGIPSSPSYTFFQAVYDASTDVTYVSGNGVGFVSGANTFTSLILPATCSGSTSITYDDINFAVYVTCNNGLYRISDPLSLYGYTITTIYSSSSVNAVRLHGINNENILYSISTGLYKTTLATAPTSTLVFSSSACAQVFHEVDKDNNLVYASCGTDVNRAVMRFNLSSSVATDIMSHSVCATAFRISIDYFNNILFAACWVNGNGVVATRIDSSSTFTPITVGTDTLAFRAIYTSIGNYVITSGQHGVFKYPVTC